MTIVMLIFLVFAFISCLHSISQWNKSLFEVESRFPYPYFPFSQGSFYAFNFSKQVPADSHKTSVSGYIKVFILKICQTVAGISMIGKFHDFFFVRVINIWIRLHTGFNPIVHVTVWGFRDRYAICSSSRMNDSGVN